MDGMARICHGAKVCSPLDSLSLVNCCYFFWLEFKTDAKMPMDFISNTWIWIYGLQLLLGLSPSPPVSLDLWISHTFGLMDEIELTPLARWRKYSITNSKAWYLWSSSPPRWANTTASLMVQHKLHTSTVGGPSCGALHYMEILQ